LLFVPAALLFVASAQEILNNATIVKMVKSGLGENLIVSMIQGQPGKYSLNADELVKLKESSARATNDRTLRDKSDRALRKACGALAGKEESILASGQVEWQPGSRV
jgi:hypothetical protein